MPRAGRCHHLMPNSRKRRRQSLLRVVDLHQVPLQQSVCQQDVHQVGLLQEPVQQKNPLVHELRLKMKNKLMPLCNKMMLCKHYIIECLNELLKNKVNLVLSRHCSVPQLPHEPLYRTGHMLLLRE